MHFMRRNPNLFSQYFLVADGHWSVSNQINAVMKVSIVCILYNKPSVANILAIALYCNQSRCEDVEALKTFDDDPVIYLQIASSDFFFNLCSTCVF